MRAPSVLTTPTTPLEHGCRRGVDVWYFDRYAQTGPPGVYAELIKVAKARVDIWDRYFTSDDHVVLAHISPGISVRHLFEGSSNATKRAGYRAQIDAANKRYPHLSFDARYCCRDEGPGFHDRFLIVDDAQVYSVGGSLNYHYRDDRSTGVIMLRQAADQLLLLSLFDEYWQRAKVP